jgi:hypothetical protein
MVPFEINDQKAAKCLASMLDLKEMHNRNISMKAAPQKTILCFRNAQL